MNLRALADMFMAWIDVVACTLLAIASRFHTPRRVRLIEGDGGLFDVEIARGQGSVSTDQVRIVHGQLDAARPAALSSATRGSQLELVLKPDHFLFRPLELPKRAIEFLHGIVCAQIDRLTPWSAGDAAFGWTRPSEIGKDRIVVTVAATTRTLINSYLTALTSLGAGSVTITTAAHAAPSGDERIRVFEHNTQGQAGLQRMRGMLAATFVIMVIVAAISVAGSPFVLDSLEAQQQELTQRVAQHRTAMLRITSGAPSQQQALERRKRETPASVLALDALTQVLPDHTYVTELRIEGDKLQVVGVTRDAPALIELIEQSPHFTRATFFAPTTRSPADAGERFHIEARIKPVFEPRT